MRFKRQLNAMVSSGLILFVAAGCGTTAPHHHSPKPNASPSEAPLSTLSHLKAGKLPVLVPENLNAKYTIKSSMATNTYRITVLTNAGMTFSFGGQYFGASATARHQLLNQLIISPGPGEADPLGSGLTARQYPPQHLITWTDGHWAIEVSGSPTIKPAMLEQSAKTLALDLKDSNLPTTPQGLLHWTVGQPSSESILVSWVRGASDYYVIEEHAANTKAAILMAASMVPVP